MTPLSKEPKESILFHFTETIEPDRNAAGKVQEFRPQSRYKNKRRLQLHKYGVGSFCRFKIPNNLNYTGVYFLALAGTITYVGECQDLN